MIISNASSTLLTQNPGTLPNVYDAMTDYFQPMTFEVVTKTVLNFQLIETQVSTSFQGVFQPFSENQLQMLPRGQRDWDWQWLHADPSLTLRTDDVVLYLETQYRVAARKDYSKYGYVEYRLVNDYTVPIAAAGSLLTEEGDVLETEGGDPITA